MLICLSDIFSRTNIILLGQVSTWKRCFQPINLIVEEISQNKSAFQTPMTSLLNEKNTMCLSDLIAY